MKKGIIGIGGFAREIYHSLTKEDKDNTYFFVDDEYMVSDIKNLLPLSKFDKNKYEIIIGVGDPSLRKSIVDRLPIDTKYFTHISDKSIILDPTIEIGEGSVICAETILTTNIKIGKHSHLNLQTTIGHDVTIGDFFTTAPGAKISGNCNIGDCVYFGTNSSVRQKINICNNVTVGLNSGVVKNITESGIYVGSPAKIIK